MADHSQPLSAIEADAARQILDALNALGARQVQRVLEHVEGELAARELPMFARTVAGPLGKLDTPVKTWLDSGTADLFRRKAAMRKQDGSAAMRDCVYAWVHGKTYTVMVAEKALHDADAMDVLAHLAGPFEGREFGGRHG